MYVCVYMYIWYLRSDLHLRRIFCKNILATVHCQEFEIRLMYNTEFLKLKIKQMSLIENNVRTSQKYLVACTYIF